MTDAVEDADAFEQTPYEAPAIESRTSVREPLVGLNPVSIQPPCPPNC